MLALYAHLTNIWTILNQQNTCISNLIIDRLMSCLPFLMAVAITQTHVCSKAAVLQKWWSRVWAASAYYPWFDKQISRYHQPNGRNWSSHCGDPHLSACVHSHELHTLIWCMYIYRLCTHVNYYFKYLRYPCVLDKLTKTRVHLFELKNWREMKQLHKTTWWERRNVFKTVKIDICMKMVPLWGPLQHQLAKCK